MEIAAFVLSGISIAFMIYQGIVNMKRDASNSDKKDAVEMTTVIVKLENIGNGISDIKSDMRNVKDEVRELRDRVIKVEDSCKHAHRRIGELHFPDKEDSGHE